MINLLSLEPTKVCTDIKGKTFDDQDIGYRPLQVNKEPTLQGKYLSKPFIIFDREDSHANMNSRLETFISKFNLKNRKYNGEKITEENLNHDYSEAYKILEVEREKSKKFLEKALDIEDNK